MSSYLLTPPANKLSETINGRVYSCAFGTSISVPDFDAFILIANGWSVVSPAQTFVSVNSANGYCYGLSSTDLSAQFGWGNVPGASNYWLLAGSVSGVGPTMVASGSDANIPANLAATGTGQFNFGNGSGQLAAITDAGGAVTAYPQLQPTSIYGGAVNYTAVAVSGANIPVSLVPVGNSGASIGPGNITTGQGSYAAGRYCSTTGFASGALGNSCVAGGLYSLAIGNSATDGSVNGKWVFASGILGSAKGTTLSSKHDIFCATSGATPAIATASGGTGDSYNGLQIANNQTITYEIVVTARDTSSGARACWNILAMFNRGASASTTTLDYSTGSGAPLGSVGTGASSWTVTLGVNTTNGTAVVTCTGAAGNTVRWNARVEGSEVMNG